MGKPPRFDKANSNFPPKLPLAIQIAAALHCDPVSDPHPDPLSCPVCGYDYMHPAECGHEQDGTLRLLNAKGEVETITGLPSPWRGGALFQVYHGECGHRVVEITRFHKGFSFRTWHRIADGEGHETTSQLWRD
jgi:hypothetical protein